MINSADKYINPFTDFGFKKLFGSEMNKDLLMDFLNELIHKQEIAEYEDSLKNYRDLSEEQVKELIK